MKNVDDFKGLVAVRHGVGGTLIRRRTLRFITQTNATWAVTDDPANDAVQITGTVTLLGPAGGPGPVGSPGPAGGPGPSLGPGPTGPTGPGLTFTFNGALFSGLLGSAPSRSSSFTVTFGSNVKTYAVEHAYMDSGKNFGGNNDVVNITDIQGGFVSGQGTHIIVNYNTSAPGGNSNIQFNIMCLGWS